MAQSAADGYTCFGANFCLAPSGLYGTFKNAQEGELYITGAGEVTATGYFKYVRPGVPIPYVTMVKDPSGHWWVSASGDSSFVVNFETTPYGDDFAQIGTITGRYWMANWGILL